MRVSERDWKTFRAVREVALDRLCARILSSVTATAADESKTFHARYLEAYRIIDAGDDQIGAAFNNPRRSTAVQQLTLMCAYDLIEPDELARFDPGVQDAVRLLAS